MSLRDSVSCIIAVMSESCEKICIIGAGAMGQLLASDLSVAGISPMLLDYKVERACELTQKGLKIQRDGGELYTHFVNVTVSPDRYNKMDWIIVFVKSYDTEGVLKSVRAMSDGSTMVLSLQNGLGHEKILKNAVSEQQIVVGITAHGAAVYDGYVRHAGRGITVIGPAYSPNTLILNRCLELASILNKAGWETFVEREIYPYRWRKLIANAAINPLTAVTGVNNGMLATDQNLNSVLRLVVRETLKIASALGVNIEFSEEDAISFVEGICVKTSENRSSMLQDITAGRRTEIEYINGAIIKAARACGIDTPINDTLSALVTFMEKNKKKESD